MPTVLITGGNRGIGLALVQAYRQEGWEVIAAVRDVSKMEVIPGVKVVRIRSDSRTDATEAVDTLGLASIELVIANAGVNHSGASFKDLHIDDLDLTWRINTVGPLILFQAVYPLLVRANGKFVVISSDRGSIGQDHIIGEGAYGISKAGSLSIRRAAVNYLVAKLHREHPDLVVLAINPGWVSTSVSLFLLTWKTGSDQDRAMGDVTAGWQGIEKTSVPVSDHLPGLMAVIAESRKGTTSGLLMNHDGKRLPW